MDNDSVTLLRVKAMCMARLSVTNIHPLTAKEKSVGVIRRPRALLVMSGKVKLWSDWSHTTMTSLPAPKTVSQGEFLSPLAAISTPVFVFSFEGSDAPMPMKEGPGGQDELQI